MVGLEYRNDYGPCTFPGLDAHHIQTRGAGGGDTKENLITVCRHHHDMAKTGQIPPEVFRKILERRYGYKYDD